MLAGRHRVASAFVAATMAVAFPVAPDAAAEEQDTDPRYVYQGGFRQKGTADGGADTTLSVTGATHSTSKTSSSDTTHIGGQTRTQFLRSVKKSQANLNTGCKRLFTDATTKRLLPTAGAIAITNTYRDACAPGLPLAPTKARPATPPPNPTLLGLEAITTLHIPAPTTSVGPDPQGTDFGFIPVNYPVWFWTDDATSLTSTTTVQGHTVTLRASRQDLTINPGDGGLVRCTTTTPWTPASAPNAEPSPTCGHTYRTPSLPRGTYTVTTQARWAVTWSVLGQSGTETLTTTSTTQLPIGELRAVLVKVPGT